MIKTSIELLSICDNALISQGGKLSIIGIFNQIFIHSVPTHFLSLTTVAIINGEPESQLKLALNILDPQGKIINKRSLSPRLSSNGKANLIVKINQLPIQKAGTYTIVLKDAHHSLKDASFQAVKIKQSHNSKLPN